jgi:cellulose biosynthesis protein BcsQ
MAVIAVFNVKGGVGKTSMAVNLAWASAQPCARRTLLWDLDPQGGSGFLLGNVRPARPRSLELFDRAIEPEKLIWPSGIERLDLLPADSGLAGIDRFLLALGKKRRLSRLTQTLATSYDRIVLDCPPQLGEVADQAVRAADVLLVPIIPSPLAMQALTDVRAHLLAHHKDHPPILPVFSMADGRRRLHREALEANPNWPVIPMASVVEQMGLRKLPVGAYAASSRAAQAFAAVWAGVERKLAERKP